MDKIKCEVAKILHIFDDEKFVDSAIRIFESVYPNQSQYLVVTEKEDLSFIYVKSKLVEPVTLNQQSDFVALSNRVKTSSSKIVFLHALNRRKQNLVNQLNEDITKVWFLWGYDLYNHWKPLKYKIYDKKTLEFLNRNYTLKSRFLNWLFYQKNIYKLFKFSKKIYKTDFYRTVQKIDIAVPVLASEMEFILSLNKKIKYAPFAYGCIEHLLGNRIKENSLMAKNILVGNSAAPTNNHVEAFLILSKLDLQGRKVIVPLNYGDKGEYLTHVLNQGYELLGENFYPLTDFLPLDEYNELILSCGFAVFNHIRQQAVGNIIIMGYFGAKLILNNKGVAYKYFKSIGLDIFSINELDNSTLNSGLDKEEFENNRKILFDNYSLESVKIKVEKLVSIAVDSVHKK